MDILRTPHEASEEAKARKRTHEMKILANGTVMKLQKTRQRKILSCVYCHSKKIKCSRVQPVCNNCDKLGIPCKYFVNERVSKRARRRRSSAQDQDDTLPLLQNNLHLPLHDLSLLKDNDPSMLPADLSSSLVAPDSVPIKKDSVSSESSHSRVNSVPVTRSSSSEYTDVNAPLTHEEEAAASFPELPAKKLEVSPHDSPNTLHMVLNSFSLKNAINPPFSPDVTTPNILQAPIVNEMSHNITNNFFNTNYASSSKRAVPEDQYSFNLSSFAFANQNDSPHSDPLARPHAFDLVMGKKTPFPETPSVQSPSLNGLFPRAAPSSSNPSTNFLDAPNQPRPQNQLQQHQHEYHQNQQRPLKKNSQPNNPGLHNCLNAYLSNPATTINYLYGTNTYYDNQNLLSDLLQHLPASRERSFELIDRYVNSVHILLPVMVNLDEFIHEHTRYWNLHDPNKTNTSPSVDSLYSTPNGSSASSEDDLDLLQFYTLYFPVLYASTISEFEEYDNLLLNQDINKYLKGFNNICQYYNYPHGIKSLPLLLGNVIIQSTSPNPSTMEMSQIIRYSKFLQLHKDPAISLRIQDWRVVKFRRLLWWVIFGLDGLSSHNFCLPPVCRYDDFNVLIPEDEDPVYDDDNRLVGKKLNVGMLSMSVKFRYDRILSELVYHLHNGLSNNITPDEINTINSMIIDLFHYIHKAINKMTGYYKNNPPKTVQEMNLLNFIKNHSWSFVDRATMLLHKKILLGDPHKNVTAGSDGGGRYEVALSKDRGGPLSLSQYEDTFGRIQESNIITNFDNSSISQLRFKQHELFTYENLSNNLIPSILHNLNDFLKYNDFIKFGKFNWYIKRTIPLDSIILLFVAICVKFKYDFMTLNELIIYVKLINKALFILNRKYFKNEKYKRMLSLTNLTWEYILKKYNVIKLVNVVNEKRPALVEFFDYQVSGFMNMNELFSVMDVPRPALISNGVNLGSSQHDETHNCGEASTESDSPSLRVMMNQSVFSSDVQVEDNRLSAEKQQEKHELVQLNEKIYYDLRNNFVDINDYCLFYSSLENVLHELMGYMDHKKHLD